MIRKFYVVGKENSSTALTDYNPNGKRRCVETNSNTFGVRVRHINVVKNPSVDALSSQLILKTILDPFKFDYRYYKTLDLVEMCATMFIGMGVQKFLSVNSDELHAFCRAVFRKYNSEEICPYHNFNHAFSTLRIATLLIHQGEKCGLDVFAKQFQCVIMLSALCHDICHNGRTNSFHLKTQSDLVQQYGDESTLESMHAFVTITLINKHSVFVNIPRHVAAEMKQNICELIISTDACRHGHVTDDLARSIEQLKVNGHPQKTIPNALPKVLFAKFIVQTADISNSTNCVEVSTYWSNQIMKEFRQQVQEEQRLNIVPLPFMERATADPIEEARSHLFFIECNVLPKWEICKVFMEERTFNVLFNNILASKSHWEKKSIVDEG